MQHLRDFELSLYLGDEQFTGGAIVLVRYRVSVRRAEARSVSGRSARRGRHGFKRRRLRTWRRLMDYGQVLQDQPTWLVQSF